MGTVQATIREILHAEKAVLQKLDKLKTIQLFTRRLLCLKSECVPSTK